MLFTLISSLLIAIPNALHSQKKVVCRLNLYGYLYGYLYGCRSRHPYTQSAYIDSSVHCFHRAANYGKTLRGKTCLVVCPSGDFYNWHGQGHYGSTRMAQVRWGRHKMQMTSFSKCSYISLVKWIVLILTNHKVTNICIGIREDEQMSIFLYQFIQLRVPRLYVIDTIPI